METKELLQTNEASPQAVEKLEVDAFTVQNEDRDDRPKEAETQNIGYDGHEFDNEQDDMKDKINEMADVKSNTHEGTRDDVAGESELARRIDESREFDNEKDDISDKINEMTDGNSNADEGTRDDVAGEYGLAQRIDKCRPQQENLETSTAGGDVFQMVRENNSLKSESQVNIVEQEYSGDKVDDGGDFESKSKEGNPDSKSGQNDLAKEKDDSRNTESTPMNQKTDKIPTDDNNLEPVIDGTEMEASQNTSAHTLDTDQEAPGLVKKAVALKNFVREKSLVAVFTLMSSLSQKSYEVTLGNSDDKGKDVSDLSKDGESKKVFENAVEKSAWNPLNYMKMSSDVDVENKTDQRDLISEGPPQPIAMKGRIILYTRLRCQESKEVRLFLYMKRLRYVEINIDVYPGRKMELEKISGSSSVPKVFFNEILIGGLSELKTLNESGKLAEKIDFLITEAPSFEAPLPPLSGEDDVSIRGPPDEMALIVHKLRESIVVNDRFCKLRRFTNCFLGSEAVDFLSEDQYLERKEAVEFARKLAGELFFQHVLDEILFEDGNHLYRFLDDDPIVASQCYNIPRGIITVKPKPIAEIASRLRFLSYAMFEAYASEDGRHVDYRSMHGSEEFARYLRTVEELQRVEICDLSREEKLAFFVNLYNMMAIHAILVWGYPTGALERRKLFGDFKYVIGGSTYSLSIIRNGILRGNQRPPYALMKPFGAKDKRLSVALPYPEPLIHFALVCGSRSGPALRCYSPGDIDKELMDAARNFLRSGGVFLDLTAKVAYASQILKWFSVDFGQNEVEVMKHVSNYLDPADAEVLLDLLSTSELKVIYQPYDWGLNC